MFVSEAHRFVFIHIHKSAGTSIAQLLNRAKLGMLDEASGQKIHKHTTVANLLEKVPELGDFYKFSVIRDPYDRLVSCYRWIQNEAVGASHYGGQFGSFDRFVQLLYERGFNRVPHDTFRSLSTYRGVCDPAGIVSYEDQSHYLFSTDDKPLVDEMVRFEDLHNGLEKVFRQLGLELDVSELPHTNKSNRDRLETYYSNPTTIKLVTEMYTTDFELLDYPAMETATAR